jgi:hypothetical protein
MTQRFNIRANAVASLTVPQMRQMLEDILSATEPDPCLQAVARHIQDAIMAIECARAAALAVMQEVDSELGRSYTTAPPGTKLC